jgi:hypothetical protein
MGLLNVIVLGLVFITAAIVFLGSFAENKAYVATGFLSSIATILVYAGAVSYTLTSSCQGMSSCPSEPIGSTVFPSGAVANWGFQSGFYLFLIGGILILFAVVFHQIFLQPKEGDIHQLRLDGRKFCSNCGHPLQNGAKFCSNCAHVASN